MEGVAAILIVAKSSTSGNIAYLDVLTAALKDQLKGTISSPKETWC